MRLSFLTRECYKKQGDIHTKNGRKVTWKEIGEARKQIKGHAKALGNVYRMGENWGEKAEGRVRSAMNENNTIIPQMCVNPKDHKEPYPDGIPKGRPVCSAANTMNQRVSDLC